jgi:hypothetical protein
MNEGALDLSSGGYVSWTGGFTGYTDVTKGAMSFWVKFNSIPLTAVHFMYLGPAVNVTFDPTVNTLTTKLATTISGGSTVYSVANITPDTNWNHYLVSWDSSDQTVRVYLNGKLINTTTGTSNPANLVSPTGTLRFGSNMTSSLGGLMDEVRFYLQPVQTSEVEKIYADGLAAHGFASK